jgi:hypothetical protein
MTLSREQYAALKAEAEALNYAEPDDGWVRADPDMPATNATIVFSMRLPAERLPALEVAAEARGMRMSQLARHWVLERLEQEQTAAATPALTATIEAAVEQALARRGLVA